MRTAAFPVVWALAFLFGCFPRKLGFVEFVHVGQLIHEFGNLQCLGARFTSPPHSHFIGHGNGTVAMAAGELGAGLSLFARRIIGTHGLLHQWLLAAMAVFVTGIKRADHVTTVP